MKIITRVEESFYIYKFEYIDCHEFIKNPSDVPEYIFDALPKLDNVKKALKDYGWEGDGEFGIIWIPPFLMPVYDAGIYLWHVKQSNNGISFLASKEDIEPQICFDDFNEQNQQHESLILNHSNNIC